MPLARLGCCCRVVACWVFLSSLLRARPLDGAGRIFLPLGDVTSRKDSSALQDPVLFGSLTHVLGTGTQLSQRNRYHQIHMASVCQDWLLGSSRGRESNPRPMGLRFFERERYH